MTTPDDPRQLRPLLEEFYAQEVILLQEGRYEAWLSLFAPNLRYVLPTRVVGPRLDEMVLSDATAYFDDDRESLALRVQRMSSDHALTEMPPSVTRYFIQLLKADRNDEGLVRATSNEAVFVYRGERPAQTFTASRHDVLESDGEGLRIVHRSVALDQRIVGNLSILF